jgi:hypothetical protein
LVIGMALRPAFCVHSAPRIDAMSCRNICGPAALTIDGLAGSQAQHGLHGISTDFSCLKARHCKGPA